MNKNLLSGTVCFVLFFFCSVLVQPVLSQQTAIYFDAEESYKKAIELFSKEKYGAAQEEFSKIINAPFAFQNKTGDEVRTNAEYYYAVCAMELYNKDAEPLLIRFVERHPESTKTGSLYFQLGKFYYRQKKYRNAIEWFEKTDTYFLTNNEVTEYYFKLGYAYFNIDNYEKANRAFYEIKDVETKYTNPANYYYAHIAYQNKNYETALQSFMKLRNAEGFSVLVPYYISQIYYLQEKYKQLIEFATPLLNQENPQNSLEITRMVGEAYYRQFNYKEAIPYLEEYHKNSGKVLRDDIYQLGYALYKTGDYERAAEKFEKTTDADDLMAQNSYYHLAGCFIKINKMQNARNAFQLAAKMNFDKNITEDALYQYAKLTYEISIQSAAVNAFQQYIKNYPDSPRADEAHEFLAEIFLTTKNYKDAITAIENIKNKSSKIKTAYQRAAYFRGVELFNDMKYIEAAALLDKSLTTAVDVRLAASAHYWKAEVLYKRKNYDDALKSYNDFLYLPAAVNLPFYNTANYNLGYVYFKKEDYPNSLVWFRKYIKNKEETDSLKYNDAVLRIADGFFIQRNFQNAADYYDEAIKNKAIAADYALFQRAVIAGIQGKFQDKINKLQSLTDNYKTSTYFDDAMYETANASFLIGEVSKSLTLYNRLVNDYPNSSYIKKALLGIALIHFNDKNDSLALMYYKKTVNDYPATAEAVEALNGIKNVYVSQSNVDDYLAYAKTIPFANIDKPAQDSITYEAAEFRFMKGDCENAVKDFNNYLDKFSDGYFAIHANFYKAECDYKNKLWEKALTGYNYVINTPKNTFTETSLFKAASIYYVSKQYENALKYYSILEEVAEYKTNIAEAVVGKMRCAFRLNKYLSAMEPAQQLIISSEKTSKEIINEAHITLAKSALAVDSIALALSEFTIISAMNSETGAEAKYNVAAIQFKLGNYQESQKTIFDLISQVPSYDDWIAKGFILLAENYVKLNDTFQAKATLQSIIDNYDGTDASIKTAAQEKLKQIVEEEKLQEQKELQEKLISTPDSLNNQIERE